MSLVTVLESEAVIISSKLLGVEREILTQVLPIIEGDAGALLLALLPIAEQVVLSLVSNPGTGIEKLNLAIPQIKELAIQAGVQAGTSVIIDAVQIITKNLNTAVASIPATPATPAA